MIKNKSKLLPFTDRKQYKIQLATNLFLVVYQLLISHQQEKLARLRSKIHTIIWHFTSSKQIAVKIILRIVL